MNDKFDEINIDFKCSKFQIKMLNKIKKEINTFVEFKIQENETRIIYNLHDLKKINDYINEYKMQEKNENINNFSSNTLCETFTNLLEKIINLKNVCNSYMLDFENIIFNIEKIYVNSNEEIFFTYIPRYNEYDSYLNYDKKNSYNEHLKQIIKLGNIVLDDFPNVQSKKKKIRTLENNLKYSQINEFEFINYVEILKKIVTDKNSNLIDKIINFNLIFLFIIVTFVANSVIIYKNLKANNYIKYNAYNVSLIYITINLIIIFLFILFFLLKQFIQEKIIEKNFAISKNNAYLKAKWLPIKKYIIHDGYTIGISDKCNLKIKSNKENIENIVFLKECNCWYMKNLNSYNNIYINNVSINNQDFVKLNNNDEIKILSKVYKFYDYS